MTRAPRASTIAANPASSSVAWTDAFWTTSHSWQVYSASTLTNFSNLSLVTANWADAGGNLFDATLGGATFNLSAVGSNVFLNYTAVPEPSTYAMMALGLAGMGLVARRRGGRRRHRQRGVGLRRHRQDRKSVV
mgnify:CR=1 FL=1